MIHQTFVTWRSSSLIPFVPEIFSPLPYTSGLVRHTLLFIYLFIYLERNNFFHWLPWQMPHQRFQRFDFFFFFLVIKVIQRLNGHRYICHNDILKFLISFINLKDFFLIWLSFNYRLIYFHQLSKLRIPPLWWKFTKKYYHHEIIKMHYSKSQIIIIIMIIIINWTMLCVKGVNQEWYTPNILFVYLSKFSGGRILFT